MTDDDPALDFLYRGFRVEAGWSPRCDTPEHIARRWLDMLDKLRQLSTVFNELWDWTDLLAVEPLWSSIDHVAERIALEAERRYDGQVPYTIVDGKKIDDIEYMAHVKNGPAEMDWGPRGIELKAMCGSGSQLLFYRIAFATDFCVTPDPDLVTPDLVRDILLAMAEGFEAVYGLAYPLLLRRNMDLRREVDPPLLTPAWWSYVGPRFAKLVEPPASAFVERRPNGALLMAATQDAFNVSNPAHRAVSDEIVASCKILRRSSQYG